LNRRETFSLKPLPIKKSEQAVPIRTVERLEEINVLLNTDVDGVIWHRQIEPTLLSALEALPAGEVENGRFCLPVDGVGECVSNHFRNWGWNIGPAQQWVADDVQVLARRLAQILSISEVRLRVELVHDDACRKFHQDFVRARLICTYSGPGTVYGIVEEDDEPARTGNTPTGMPILLKGRLWPGPSDPTLKHRSPQISGTGISRLVIVLDEAPADRERETSSGERVIPDCASAQDR